MATLSPAYVASVNRHDDEIMRTTGRQLEISGLAIDFLMGLYLITVMAFLANAFRLNVYTPSMMSPWHNWAPYWRVFSPTWFSLPTLYFTYVLLFYRRGGLLIFFAILEVLFIAFFVVCWAYLIADWIDCKNTFWCTCIVAYTSPIAWTNCAEGNGASGVFLAHFFLLLTLIVMMIIAVVMAVWIYQTYSALLRAKMNANPFRDQGAYGMINSEASESAPSKRDRVYNAAPGRPGALLPPLTARRMGSQQDV